MQRSADCGLLDLSTRRFSTTKSARRSQKIPCHEEDVRDNLIKVLRAQTRDSVWCANDADDTINGRHVRSSEPGEKEVCKNQGDG